MLTYSTPNTRRALTLCQAPGKLGVNRRQVRLWRECSPAGVGRCGRFLSLTWRNAWDSSHTSGFWEFRLWPFIPHRSPRLMGQGPRGGECSLPTPLLPDQCPSLKQTSDGLGQGKGAVRRGPRGLGAFGSEGGPCGREHRPIQAHRAHMSTCEDFFTPSRPAPGTPSRPCSARPAEGAWASVLPGSQPLVDTDVCPQVLSDPPWPLLPVPYPWLSKL